MAKGGEAWQPLGFVLAVGAVAVCVAVLLPRWLGSAGGPQSEILSALQHAQSRGVELAIPGSSTPLVSQNLRWARITVTPFESDPLRAQAVATLDFEGTFGETRVSSLGLEKIPFVFRDGEWVPETSLAPLLSRIVATLEQRRSALAGGDAAKLEKLSARASDLKSPEITALLQLTKRRYSARTWYIRSERDEVLVTESFQLEGEEPDRPVNEVGNRRLTLKPDGQEFVFATGLM